MIKDNCSDKLNNQCGEHNHFYHVLCTIQTIGVKQFFDGSDISMSFYTFAKKGNKIGCESNDV